MYSNISVSLRYVHLYNNEDSNMLIKAPRTMKLHICISLSVQSYKCIKYIIYIYVYIYCMHKSCDYIRVILSISTANSYTS